MKKKEKTGKINVRATVEELTMLAQLAKKLKITRRQTIWIAVAELAREGYDNGRYTVC